MSYCEPGLSNNHSQQWWPLEIILLVPRALAVVSKLKTKTPTYDYKLATNLKTHKLAAAACSTTYTTLLLASFNAMTTAIATLPVRCLRFLTNPISTTSSLTHLHVAHPPPKKKNNAEIANERSMGVPKTVNSALTFGSHWGSNVLQSLMMWLGHWLPYKQMESYNTHWNTKTRWAHICPPNSLHRTCMCFLRWKDKPELDIFCVTNFTEFQTSLNSEIKRLQSEG